MGIFNILGRNKNQVKLPFLGNVTLEKSNEPDYNYESIIEEYILGENNFQINIYFKEIDSRTIEHVRNALKNLEKINDIVIQEYLRDCNNENYREFIDKTFKQIFTESEFDQLILNSTYVERLLSAFRIANIKLKADRKGISIILYYIFGYEFKFIFEMDGNYEIKGYKIEPGSFLCSKQFGDFALKFEDPDVDKNCGRFIKDWWNEPIRSYYIYHMAERVKKYL